MSAVAPLNALNLDISQQQSFVRYFRSLPEKPACTIRFFNRTEYYTVHGDDATFAAQELFNTSTVKLMGEEPKLTYLVLNTNNFEKFVRELLLVKQYRVEVYVKPTQSRQNDWILEYKGSPGNLSQFEDILFDTKDVIYNNAILGVKLGPKQHVGISCINTTECTIQVGEFTDNEFFTELEAVLVQMNPRECIVPQGDTPELNSLKNIFSRNGILVMTYKKTEYIEDDIAQDLNRLLFFEEGQQKNALALPETRLKDAMSSLQSVIKHLNLMENGQNFNQYRISVLNFQQYVRLDSSATYALNLFPKPGTSVKDASKKNATLLGVLDHCNTQQGHRLLERWMKQPLKDINLINERLEVVEALVKDSEARQLLHTGLLSRIPDLLILAKKLSNKKAGLQECYAIYQAVGSLPGLIGVLRKLENKYVKSMIIDPICEILNDMDKYQSMVELTIDLERVERDEFLIKPSFNDTLQELNKQKNGIEEKMQKCLRKAADELGLESGKSIKLDFTEQHGSFFRVTLKEEHALRRNKKFIIIDAVKGGARFTNEQLKELNESLTDLNTSYEKEQKLVVQEVVDVAAGYADTLRNLNLLIGQLDVMLSFAKISTSAPIPYTKPKLLAQGSGILKLRKVRHPCLERLDGFSYIPNNVDFRKGEKHFYIITGPNMGGKSTYIRSIAVSVLMAQIGCFVPCDDAEISIVDGILARVGADDSLSRGLSTFMQEMVEAAGVVRSATADSLVVVDELGRGTSTYDGCGLAYAIAEYLAKNIQCYSLFATHFHEISSLAEKIPPVHNLHITAVVTENVMTPLYQVRDGPCDKSYGIQCARLAGFPPDVLEFAQEILEKLEYSQAVKYVKDYEPSIRMKIVEEGEQLVLKISDKLKNSNADALTDVELHTLIEECKSELTATNNLYIKGLLEQ